MQPNAGRGFQVDVLDPEVSDFLDARAGVVQEEHEDAIPQGVRPLGGQSIKQRGDVVTFQTMRFWRGHALNWDRGDLLTDDKLIGQAARQVLKQDDEHYTVTGWSIGAITRWLTDQGVPTRKPGTRWERSTVWAMLRNPAYVGIACFGKTRAATRQRVTRPLRLRGGLATRDSAKHDRPREEWIEIPVPALIDEPTFARAQELLQENKVRARRRTLTPTLVQGLVSCRRCGHALSRTSTRSSARVIQYYRCIGSDAWRHLGGPRCHTRPVRQDLLDDIVWTEVIRLLEDPTLIQQELDRRLAVARAADPTRQREQALQRDLVRVGKNIERLLTAYQEDLLSLEQLRERMPPLRQREQALQ